MSAGLSVNGVVNVQVVLSPLAAAMRNFGNLLLLGSSDVIDVTQRLTYYTSITGVAADFGTAAPEYSAAALFFSQSPQPVGLYIGRWAQTATKAILHGGLLSTAQQAIANFNTITTGGFKITIDGTQRTLGSLNFSSATNMNAVAAVVNTALGLNGSCVWNSVYNRFDVAGVATGAGAKASGTITFSGQPAPSDTVTIAGTAITFVASGATGNQVNIGASTAATAAALQAFLVASADVNLVTCTYALNTTTNVITVTAVTAGTAGNSITLAKTSTNITVSGATLSGGLIAGAIAYAIAPSSGVDVSGLLGLTAATGALTPVQGVNAETLLAGVNCLATKSNDWYGLNVAASGVTDADHVAVAGYIEAASPSRIYGLTSQDSTILNAATTTDIASQLKALGYNRSFVQYSSSTPYAAISIFGRTFTVDFTGSNTALTVKFKQEPGVAAETITETQAASATTKNCNIFVNYNNSTAIVQQGVMASGQFFDTIHGTDWMQNAVQTAVYNLLYTSSTKIPQTDAGIALISATVESVCAQAVTNGLLAPGVWNASGFGALKQGQSLEKGYYVYAPPVALQSQADRAARKAPTMQVAAKLAGAVHSANVIINVNS